MLAQSLLPYWHHGAWGAIYLGVGVCTVYVHVPLVRSVNMVIHVPHVHVATHGRRNVIFVFLERSLLVWRISRTATLRLYKKNLVLRSGAALDNNSRNSYPGSWLEQFQASTIMQLQQGRRV